MNAARRFTRPEQTNAEASLTSALG